MKVMTFNILDESGGKTGWSNEAGTARCSKAIKTIKLMAPDIIGLQEDARIQDEHLLEGLGGVYARYGVGGLDGKDKGRFNSIFYRKDRFELLGGGTIWLGNEPDKPAPSFHGKYPRTTTWIRLRDRKSDLTFLVVNAHWDNGLRGNRVKSAELLRERMPKLAGGAPVIVTGDLNCFKDSGEFQSFIGAKAADGLKLTDAYDQVHGAGKTAEGTIGNPSGQGPRIDYVLYSGPFRPTEAVIYRKPVSGGWPSDHFPLTVTFQFETQAK